MRKVLLIIALAACCSMFAQTKEHHPYSDDKLLHYGGFIGVNLPSYIAQPDNFYTPKIGYGLAIGGFVDVRMGKYLNLRVSPSYNANYINIKEGTDNSTGVKANKKDSINTLAMPFSIPLHIKWSAKRIGNYRPYLLGGGGVSFDFNTFDEEEKDILTKKMNYFAEIGLGCDFYTKWFRCSPEIKYQLGFNNMLSKKHATDGKHMHELEKLTYHQISIVFNFGSL